MDIKKTLSNYNCSMYGCTNFNSFALNIIVTNADLNVVGKELTIDSVSREHAGDYECVADNGISPSAEKKIRLDVLCKFFIIFFKVLANSVPENSDKRLIARVHLCIS